MKQFCKRFAPLLLTVLLLTGHTLAADTGVTTVKDAFGDANTIYLAGNPDAYPVEYYDRDTECFAGIMPQVLERVSKETGVSFTYLRGGRRDERLRLAQNGQVEIVSCVPLSDTRLLDALKMHSDVLFSCDADGTMVEYCIGYTQIATPELAAKIDAALAQIEEGELVGISINAAGDHPGQRLNALWLAIIGGIALLLLLAVILLSVRLNGQKEPKEESKTKNELGLLTPDAFHTLYGQMISEEVRTVYIIAYFSFDTETMARNYGYSAVTRQLSMASDEVLLKKNPEDLLTMDGTGVIAARIAGNEENAESWVQEVLKTLNGAVESNSTLYFRAGLYGLTREDGDCTTAIQNARQSYLAAAKKGIDYQFCTKELLQQVKDRQQLSNDAMQAFGNREFKLYLQMVVTSDTHQVAGAEALTRWEHPTRGLIHPGAFIDALSETGAIRQLDFYIFDAVCHQLQEWQEQGLQYYISCNFTRNTIESSTFCDELLKCAEKYHFDHSKLVLEITENTIENNRGQAMNNVTTCRKAGFHIALDDLGSGATSFADLRDYPLDMVKIDRSILTKADTPRGRTLLGSIVHLAREMQFDTLCEGVEKMEDAEMLKEMRCELIQGYLFFRPMPAEVVQDYLKTHPYGEIPN